MRRLLTLALLWNLSAMIWAQIPANQMTGPLLNCRFWNAMPREVQDPFLIGFKEAIAWAKPENSIHWPKATIGEIREGISSVCVAPENARVPVLMAIFVFSERINGNSEDAIRRILESARREAARLGADQ